MGNNIKEKANFTPILNTYKKYGAFRFWCQQVLPLTFDDSLSYYELLNKLVEYLNKIIENVNNLGSDFDSLFESYNKLEDYVNNYFKNLDVQQEIDNKLDEMAADGSLSEIIGDWISKDVYWNYNDSGYLPLEKISNYEKLEIPEGFNYIQGGTFVILNGVKYLFCIIHTGNNNDPLTMGKFNLNTGVCEDTIVINQNGGHGNAVSYHPSGYVVISDANTQSVYWYKLSDGEIKINNTGWNSPISSLCFNRTGDLIVTCTTGQNNYTWFSKLPYDKDMMFYQIAHSKMSYSKGTGLCQDMEFVGSAGVSIFASLVTHSVSNYKYRRNMIRFMGVNGIKNKDVYFDTSIAEPECISWDTIDKCIYIVGSHGEVYKTTSEFNENIAGYFGNGFDTQRFNINVEPSCCLWLADSALFSPVNLNYRDRNYIINKYIPSSNTKDFAPSSNLDAWIVRRVQPRYTLSFLGELTECIYSYENGWSICFNINSYKGYNLIFKYRLNSENYYWYLYNLKIGYNTNEGWVTSSVTSINYSDYNDFINDCCVKLHDMLNACDVNESIIENVIGSNDGGAFVSIPQLGF